MYLFTEKKPRLRGITDLSRLQDSHYRIQPSLYVRGVTASVICFDHLNDEQNKVFT